VFGAVAAPLGNIDKVVVIDQGGGNGNASSGMTRLANTGPAVLFNLLQQLQALGLDVPTVMKQLGIETNGSGEAKTEGKSESKAASKRE
jgi:uncharacterized membrane protein YqiK